MEPVIKWSGSKRSQAVEIVSHFPKKIETYYEPFCGGCSVFHALVDNPSISVEKYVLSDLNGDLMNLWTRIAETPDEVASRYTEMWTEMNSTDDRAFKRSYFENVRERFNKERDPLDFMFIMRTTTNGMPRYNSKGEFNNSYHITRDGMNPVRLERIIHEWSKLLNSNNVEFRTCSYKDITPSEDDFMYLDPPYARTKGMYFGGFNNIEMFDWLKMVKCPYILSYDGISGKVNNTYDVPKELYDTHVYLYSGNSSFKRVIGNSRNSNVFESLYIKGK